VRLRAPLEWLERHPLIRADLDTEHELLQGISSGLHVEAG
jgi:hypothetical protein